MRDNTKKTLIVKKAGFDTDTYTSSGWVHKEVHVSGALVVHKPDGTQKNYAPGYWLTAETVVQK